MNRNNNWEENEIMDSDMQEILELLSEIPQVPVPAQFDLNLRRGLKAEKAKKRTRIYRRLAAVAAVFAVGVTSVLFAQDGLHIFTDQLQKDGFEQSMQKPKESNDVAAPQQPAKLSNEDNPPVKNTENDNGAEEAAAIAEDKQTRYDNGIQEKNLDTPSIVQDATAGYGITPGDSDNAKKEMGSDEGMPQAASLEDGISVGNTAGNGRSTAGFRSMDTFEVQAAQNAEHFSQAMNNADEQALCSLKTDVSAQAAEAASKLYRDLFQGKELTVKKIDEKSLAGVNQTFQITGNGKQTWVNVKAVDNGIIVSEAILDHGLWLTEQLKGSDFTLQDYTVSPEDGSITFQVLVFTDEKHTISEVRSITWKKTES